MLQMTIAPPTAPAPDPAPPSMADALPILDALEAAGTLSGTTAGTYRSSVRRLETLVQTPLEGIPCAEAWIEARFPARTFDPDMFPSAPAQDQFRRRLLAVARHASGEIAAARARRARVDDWAALQDALEEQWNGLVAAGVVSANNASKNAQIPLGTLADCARREGLGVHPLTGSALVALAEDLDTSQRESVARAAALLDAARVVPGLADLLPAAPLDYKPAPRRPADRPLPGAFEAEVAGWVHAATHFGWDELDEEYEKKFDPEGGPRLSERTSAKPSILARLPRRLQARFRSLQTRRSPKWCAARSGPGSIVPEPMAGSQPKRWRNTSRPSRVISSAPASTPTISRSTRKRTAS